MIKRCVSSMPVCVFVIALAMTGTASAVDEDVLLFSYFTGQADGARLAYSFDGLNWTELNHGNPVVTPLSGQLIRDPDISRGPDGKYHMVWTTDWSGNTIGHAWSHDLMTWHDKKNIGVMADEPNAQNVWAPEMVYDSINQNHLIFWSSRVTGQFNDTSRIYSTTTTDFSTFSDRQLFYNPGYDVIDATITEAGNDYAMFIKAEAQGDKAIYMATASTQAGPYSAPGPGIVGLSVNGVNAEGPTMAKLGDTYYLYWDYYTQGRIGAATSQDLQSWTEVTDQLNMPGHHGSVLKLSSSEFKSLFLPAAALSHRYSFSADATDSIGAAHGTLSNGASISGGAVQLDGVDDYVDLPAGEIGVPTKFTNLTFEAWFTFEGSPGESDWVRVFDFGDTSESVGTDYIFMTPVSAGGDVRARISDADPGYSNEQGPNAGSALSGGSYHVAVVYDEVYREMRLYVDGILQGTADITIPLSSVSDTLAYLGRSLYDADPFLDGSIDEFRIWGGVLSEEQVLRSFIAGADAVNPARFVGDFNGDGVVDAVDYDIWRANYGSTAAQFADGNADGAVNNADYDIWRDSVALSQAEIEADGLLPVPEPASLLSLVTCVGLIGWRRPQKQLFQVRTHA